METINNNVEINFKKLCFREMGSSWPLTPPMSVNGTYTQRFNSLDVSCIVKTKRVSAFLPATDGNAFGGGRANAGFFSFSNGTGSNGSAGGGPGGRQQSVENMLENLITREYVAAATRSLRRPGSSRSCTRS
eukprot:TRINITY_DN45052_c0_g2_i3.p3 TRINITY_DN45052_c0_g2~~TRINITY_DN45052_c0_g2_i3.p3  ORF type:complete len:132 (-),score=18.86 TRINITY_DN45052_c0_g2_i3:673-1068(-)